MKRKIWVLLGVITVAGCKSTVPVLETTPEYLATAYERKPLVVDHRDWISEGCYPKRILKNDKWVEVKVCDKK